MYRQLPFLATALVLAGATHAAPDRPPPHATAQQQADLEGIYALDNGQRARIFLLDGRLYIDLPRQRKELVPVAPGVFASRDGKVSVQPGAGGDGRIVVGYRPAAQDAEPARYAAAGRARRGAAD
jgi:hypothetical protein